MGMVERWFCGIDEKVYGVKNKFYDFLLFNDQHRLKNGETIN